MGTVRRRLLLGLALALALAAGLAPAARGAEVTEEMVKFPGGAGPIAGYLARPQGPGPFPAVLVIHEWWGLTDWVKENARRLAEQGYVALAVDLYGGKVTADPGEAHELMRALDDGEAIADLKGAVAFLGARPEVAPGHKLASIGWCMGGKYARLIAQESAAVGPTVICYGSVATEPNQVARLKGKPVLGIFGADDRGIPADKVRQFEAALKAQGNPVDMHIYEGAGHGFMRPGGPQHAAGPAADAWKQIDAFLKRTLAAAP
jgi:carboxymethylenebutenolidase